MNMRTRFIWILSVGLATAGMAVGQFPQFPPEWQSLKIQETAEPIFPHHLETLGVTEGVVHVAINTDSTGKLLEYLVVGYTHPEFADAAVNAIKQWKFEPARLHGEPVGTTIEVVFHFETKGTIVSTMSVTDSLEAQFLRLLGKSYAYQPCSLRELDQIPTPIITVKPLYPAELAAKGVKGKVTIEFYIDESGAVRMPAVSANDNAQLTALALAALRQWRFEPPTRNGHPVLVRASQLFNFAPST